MKTTSEHLALYSDLELRPFCKKLEDMLELSRFSYDSENETEWGIARQGDVEYNVSRPYEQGTLHEWDKSVPRDCNFAISLKFPGEQKAAERKKLVEFVGGSVSKTLKATVHHHRTWLGPGDNVQQTTRFDPQ